MLWVSRFKEGARTILKEHPASVCTFFISFLFWGILSYEYELKFPDRLTDVLTFLRYFFLSITAAFALCEANFLYKKSIGKIESLKEISKSFVYIIVMVIGILMSLAFSLFRIQFFGKGNDALFGLTVYDVEEVFLRFFLVFMVICISSTVFFLYKRNDISFEEYTVKGFLGIMKGYLAYGVITLGAMCIIWVFQTLLFEIDVIELVLCLISGLMSYTMILVAMEHPGEKISKFGNIMMGYVFPGILVVALVIVYVYILKILLTWTFPSNKAFAIVTALFVSGVCIWTMAQGCTEAKYHMAMRMLPILFIPFIVIQSMCLFMRIEQYGLTQSRYMGIALIVFEIVYEAYYIVRLCFGKGLGGFLFPVLIAFSLVILLVPGINIFASVTRSQKKVVEKVVEEISAGKEVESKELARAKSAYNEIDYDGGLEGTLYLNKLYDKYTREKVDKYLLGEDGAYSSLYMHFSAESERESVDISGYSKMSEIEAYFYEEEVDTTKLPLRAPSSDKVLKEADLSEIITTLEENYDPEYGSAEYGKYIEEPVKFEDGSCLYINYLYLEENEGGVITDLTLRGYYLY